MSTAREIGNNLIKSKVNIDNILRSLLTNNENIQEYQTNTTYHYDDIVYKINTTNIDVYRAVRDNFTETVFTPSNWQKINIENFYFGDNSPVISNTQPTDNHTKIWIKPNS